MRGVQKYQACVVSSAGEHSEISNRSVGKRATRPVLPEAGVNTQNLALGRGEKLRQPTPNLALTCPRTIYPQKHQFPIIVLIDRQ